MGFWFVFAFIVVLYNIIWDVKFDFGFLESFGKNKYLRELLAINNPMIYYACKNESLVNI